MLVFEKDELANRVGEVLFYIWDSIGVSPEPGARWEYKSCEATVLRQLGESDSIIPISEYLAGVMTKEMGLSVDNKLCDETAENLMDHKHAIRDGIA